MRIEKTAQQLCAVLCLCRLTRRSGHFPALPYPPGRRKQITTCPLNGKINYPKRGVKKALFTAKKPQGEIEIGAAPFRCGLIGYHLKLDSLLS
jgi:hypothetical protein